MPTALQPALERADEGPAEKLNAAAKPQPNPLRGFLASAREAAGGLSQSKMAALLGVATTWYVHLEHGRQPWTVERLELACKHLSCTTEQRRLLYRLTVGLEPYEIPDLDKRQPIQDLLGELKFAAFHGGPELLVTSYNERLLEWMPSLPDHGWSVMRAIMTDPDMQDRLINLRTDWIEPSIAQARELMMGAPPGYQDQARRLLQDLRRSAPEYDELWCSPIHVAARAQRPRQAILHGRIVTLRQMDLRLFDAWSPIKVSIEVDETADAAPAGTVPRAHGGRQNQAPQ